MRMSFQGSTRCSARILCLLGPVIASDTVVESLTITSTSNRTTAESHVACSTENWQGYIAEGRFADSARNNSTATLNPPDIMHRLLPRNVAPLPDQNSRGTLARPAV